MGRLRQPECDTLPISTEAPTRVPSTNTAIHEFLHQTDETPKTDPELPVFTLRYKKSHTKVAGTRIWTSRVPES